MVDGQKDFFRDERKLERIEPYQGDLDGISSIVVTGREDSVSEVTKYWLKRNFSFNRTLYTTNWNNSKKIEKILSNNPHTYVDDNIGILRKIREKDKRVLLYLVTQSWNQASIKPESKIIRVNGINEILSNILSKKEK